MVKSVNLTHKPQETPETYKPQDMNMNILKLWIAETNLHILSSIYLVNSISDRAAPDIKSTKQFLG